MLRVHSKPLQVGGDNPCCRCSHCQFRRPPARDPKDRNSREADASWGCALSVNDNGFGKLIKTWSKAAELDSKNPETLLMLGIMKFSAGNFKGASADLMRSLELTDNVYAMLFRYLARARDGEIIAAAELERIARRVKTKEWPYAVAVLHRRAVQPSEQVGGGPNFVPQGGRDLLKRFCGIRRRAGRAQTAKAVSAVDIVPFRALPPETQWRVQKLSENPHFESLVFARSCDKPWHYWLALLVVGAIALGSSALLILASAEIAPPILATLLLINPANLYTLVLIFELLRRSRSRLRPFQLVTPLEIIEGDYDHGMIIRRPLYDATGFRSFTSAKGWTFEFTFDWDKVAIICKDRPNYERLTAVLEKARAAKADPALKEKLAVDFTLIPPSQMGLTNYSSRTPNRTATRPFSELWRAIAAVFIAIALIFVSWGRRH